MSLEENIARVKENIARAAREAGRDPGEVALVAATKVQTSDTIRAAIAAGVGICGENRVQELTGHLEDGAYEGARVHFIGHLQTNKVRQVVGRTALIQSVDSLHLLQAIDRQADKLGLKQDILLEVNVGGEASKSGCLPEALPDLIQAAGACGHIRLRGLMAIPPISSYPGANRRYFAQMYQLFIDMRGKMSDNQSDMDCLSMGMSADFEDAIAEGATLVRVGTALFGPRPPMGER